MSEREVVVAALEAVDAVTEVTVDWWTHDALFRLNVYFEQGTQSHAPIAEVCRECDLVIWSVGFDVGRVTLVPREGFKHEYDGADMEGSD